MDQWIDENQEPPDEAFEPSDSAPRLRAWGPDLASLPIAGITRRRAAWVLAAIVSIWIVAVFARQVGDAGAATGRADRLRVENAVLVSQVDALSKELEVVQRQAFIEQQARAYGLGGARERPFTLGPDASPLPADAPGSASVRLGAGAAHTSPLNTWLDLLFGPSGA
jgi:cell division protein FtsB